MPNGDGGVPYTDHDEHHELPYEVKIRDFRHYCPTHGGYFKEVKTPCFLCFLDSLGVWRVFVVCPQCKDESEAKITEQLSNEEKRRIMLRPF